jgi:hypothetical protein
MKAELEEMLLFAIKEFNLFPDDGFILNALKSSANILLSRSELFESIPETLTFSYIKNELNLPYEPRVNNCSFERRAVLIFDKLEAAAFGRMRYIYKSKGCRLYMLDDGALLLVSPNCEVNYSGFQLHNEMWMVPNETIYELDDVESAKHYLNTMLDEDNVYGAHHLYCSELLRMLCNIKKPFIKDYPVEYLLTPTDVNVLSGFSKDVRECLWGICLSDYFLKVHGRDYQNKAISILTGLDISPPPELLLKFIKNAVLAGGDLLSMKKQFDDVMELLSSVHDKVSNFESLPFLANLHREIDDTHVFNGFSRKSLLQSDAELIVKDIIEEFIDLVENKGIWKSLWNGDVHLNEDGVQRIFYITALQICKSFNLDLTPEANSGNGPVDFKFSQGYSSKVVVEIKLSTNTNMIHGYETQLNIYKDAESTSAGYFLVVDFGGLGSKLEKVNKIKDCIIRNGKKASEIFYVDATKKASASKR